MLQDMEIKKQVSFTDWLCLQQLEYKVLKYKIWLFIKKAKDMNTIWIFKKTLMIFLGNK